MINLMLEGVAEWVTLEESPSRRSRVTISPGVRTGWNFQRGEAQTIIGVGLPVVFADDGSHNAAVLLYLSYESRFRK
jgi:hypothetical protein